MTMKGTQKTLLLVGGGHAHLHILKRLQSESIRGVRVVLVSPAPFQYYSGMIAGYVEGLYSMEEIRCDLRRLALAADVTFIEDMAAALDPIKQILYTDKTNLALGYDAISFDIGSQVGGTHIPGSREHGMLIKPVERFVQTIESVDWSERIVIVGGGATGIELSLALLARSRKNGVKSAISLISSGPLMEKAAGTISKKITEMVQVKGIHVYSNDPVVSVQLKHAVLRSGMQMPFDRLLWLTGPEAPDLFAKAGLRVNNKGYLHVNQTLQAIDFPNVFGAGDCIAIDGYPAIAKAGVYAVKAAPVLWNNLNRFFDGRHLMKYRPQPHYLSLLSTGQMEAFLLYRNLIVHGSWCWKLKTWIDKRFMRQYQSTNLK